MATLFSTNALAYDPPPAPANGWYVVDQSGKLSESQKQRLNQKIEQVSKATKNEFGILLLSNMDGNNIEDVANATYKTWGVGKRGLDNGCLIVVAIKERKSRIETGKGVGGEVSDLQANDILRNHLNPHLKSGDFYGGFDDTLGALSTLMESRINQKAEAPPIATVPAPVTQPATSQRTGGCQVAEVGAASTGGTWLILLLLGVGASVAIFIARSVRRRQEQEERDRLLVAQRRAEKLQRIRQEQERLDKERRDAVTKETARRAQELLTATIPTPPVAPARVAHIPLTRPATAGVARIVRQPSLPSKPVSVKPSTVVADTAVVAGAAALYAAEEAHQTQLRREREAEESRASEERRAKAEREDEERRARQRERDDEDRRRRDREDDDRRRRDSESSSSSSSSSSYDSGSSSGGGFGGGDSGGGGSSSDW